MRLLFLVAVLLLAGVGTAAAHEVTGDGSTGVASDARSSVVADDLLPGVTFEVLQNGLAVRLHNGSSSPVVVHEPGLVIAPDSSVQWHLDAARQASPTPCPSACSRKPSVSASPWWPCHSATGHRSTFRQSKRPRASSPRGV
jgi:hypothetical protein